MAVLEGRGRNQPQQIREQSGGKRSIHRRSQSDDRCLQWAEPQSLWLWWIRGAVKASTEEKGQFTVRIRTLLVPPLVQPRLPLLPDGVCTSTLKVPGAETMEEGIETVS